MNKNEKPLTLNITDLARGGAGVARDEGGRVIFVPFTAPGDKVLARVVSSERRYAQGELIEVLESSPKARITPKCSVFGRCGGCQWQHIDYEIQWQTKSRGVRHALERVGVKPPQAAWDEFKARSPWEYRNRVQLRGAGGAIGFFANQSHELVPINTCPIARPEINSALEQTRQEGSALNRPYKVEVEIMPSGELRKIWNAPHGAGGFRQVNDEQNAKLQQWVRSQLEPADELLDLFGGSGNLSLPLADKMEQIHCIDLSAPAGGSEGRPDGAPANITFHMAAALPWLLRFKEKAETGKAMSYMSNSRAAIVDPPRSGLGSKLSEIVGALKALKVRELIAVGCDPDNWSKDIFGLIRLGWNLERVAIFDFFPQTPHIESAAKLTSLMQPTS